jgi:hypothetical protein
VQSHKEDELMGLKVGDRVIWLSKSGKRNRYCGTVRELVGDSFVVRWDNGAVTLVSSNSARLIRVDWHSEYSVSTPTEPSWA